jgi:PAS domain S-box-containing protein
MTNPDTRPNDAVDLRQKAESLARQRAAQTPEDIAALSPEDIRNILHELRVHQIELEMQNEELRTAQAELEASRFRYFDLYDLAPVGYCILSEQGLILEANLTAATLLGTPRSALIKQPISRLILKDDQTIYYLYRKQLFETGESQECELRLVTSDGALFWAHLKGTAAQAEDGAPLCRVVISDITDRKQAEEALKKSEEKYRLIAENMSDVISLLDMDLRFTYVSPSIARLSGFSVDESLKLSIEDIMTPDSLSEVLKIFEEEIMADGLEKNDPYRSRIIEYKQYTKDRSIVWVESNCRFLRDMDQKPVGILIISRDITERKVAGEEKEQLQSQLNQAQKMESVGRLAGGVAHDFNNMLGVILGHAELALLKADEDNDLISDLKEIQTAAKRSANLTKQLLTFARKEIISPRKLDLNDTVESMLNMLRRLIGEDIDLVWKPAAHIWPVKMDPSQIDQILANLCVNARDAIDGVGKLTIETGRKTFDEDYCSEHPGFIPGDFVLLAVSDNGCGMDKDTLSNLFEPFFTTKAVGKGTGLGLATIYGIVKQNSGFINVYSEPGQGSTFKIYLPRLVAAEDIDKAVPEKKAAAGGTETILLVEDEPTILRMTRMMLERKGYSVLPAATPGEAIEIAGNHTDKIHLLMTDVVMPEMNGRDLAGQLIRLYPEIKLLFMSGYTADVIAHQGVLDEGVAFIQKPFSMAEMTEKVRKVLDTASDKN